MDKLKKKLSNYKKLADNFSDYFAKFSETIGKYHEEELKACRTAIADYAAIVADLLKTPKIQSPDIAFKLVHEMANADLCVNDIRARFEYFNPGKHRFSHEFSATYMLETSLMFDTIMGLITHINKKNMEYSHVILTYLCDQILSSKRTSFEDIHTCYQTYTDSASLYAHVTQKIIDAHDPDDPGLADILNAIEDDKSQALSTGKASPHFTGIKANPPLLTFGLIPISDIMSLDDVISKIFNRGSAGRSHKAPLKILHDLGAHNKIGIIIQRKITVKPTNYNIESIMSKTRKSVDDGIDSSLIIKFRTIYTLDPDQYNFDIGVYGYDIDKCESVVILNEIATGIYKIMARNPESYVIPSHTMRDFIKFSKVGVINKPPRAENYNRLMTHRMLNNMFLGQRVNLVQISEKSQVDEIKFLRNELRIRTMEHYTKLVESCEIMNNKQLVKIANASSIKDVFMETLIKNYYGFLRKNGYIDESKNSRGFVFTEVIATFLAQLHTIIRGFVREVFSNSEKHTLDNADYAKQPNIVRANMLDALDLILKESLNKILGDKTNIYQALIYKTMLLNVLA